MISKKILFSSSISPIIADMLKLMRVHTKRIFIAILVLIIPAFCFFGIDMVMRDAANNSVAGKLYGKSIKFDKFSLAFQETRTQVLAEMILLFGVESFDQLRGLQNRLSDFFSRRNLNQLTWDRLLLLHLVKKEKVQVDRAEVVRWISNFPLFQQDGTFKSQRYQSVLRNVFVTSSIVFEKQLKRSLQIRQLQATALLPVEPTQEEIEQAYIRNNEKVAIEFVMIEGSSFKKNIKLSDIDVKAYYEINKEKFRVPEQIKAEYFVLKQKDVDSTELFYEQITDISIALIQKPVSEVANEFGLDLKTTPFFSKKSSPLPTDVTKEAFQLDLATYSSPLSYGEDIYLIQVIEKRPSAIPPFKDCKVLVRKEFEQSRLTKLAQAQAQRKRDDVIALLQEETLPFAQAVKKAKLSVQSFPPFSRNDPLGVLPKRVQIEAFQMKENEVSRIIPTPTGALFFAVIDKQTPKYEEDTQLINSLRSQKQKTYYQKWLANKKQEANLIDLTPFF